MARPADFPILPLSWGASTLRKQGGEGNGQGPEGPAPRESYFLRPDFLAALPAPRESYFLGPDLDLGLRPRPEGAEIDPALEARRGKFAILGLSQRQFP